MAAMIPMMTSVIISSIKLKPFEFCARRMAYSSMPRHRIGNLYECAVAGGNRLFDHYFVVRSPCAPTTTATPSTSGEAVTEEAARRG
jgi:hypothetical protein